MDIPFDRPPVFPSNGLLGARVCVAMGSHALLPRFVADGELFWGEDRLQDALCVADVPTSVEGLRIRPARSADTEVIVELWRDADLLVPHNDPLADIAAKRAQQAESFLVAERHGAIVGVCMGGYDGHRGWLNYLAIAPEHRRGGTGRALVAAVEARLRASGCPKVNLQVRADNAAVTAFYVRLGYSLEDRVGLGKRL